MRLEIDRLADITVGANLISSDLDCTPEVGQNMLE